MNSPSRGILAAWLYATQQERGQEDGWLTEQLRVPKGRLRKLLESKERRARL